MHVDGLAVSNTDQMLINIICCFYSLYLVFLYFIDYFLKYHYIWSQQHSELCYIFPYYNEEIASERLHVNSQDLNLIFLSILIKVYYAN